MSEDREIRLQRYLDGHMDPAEREAFELELLNDGELMAETYDETVVREAMANTAHARRVSFKVPRRRGAVGFLAVAVAACIGFFAFILPRPDHDEVFRGMPGAPVAVAPVGEVDAVPDTFVWTRDLAAARYRLEIFNSSGDRLHVTTTPDTFFVTGGGLALPRVGTWRATTIDSVGVGIRSTGKVDFATP